MLFSTISLSFSNGIVPITNDGLLFKKANGPYASVFVCEFNLISEDLQSRAVPHTSTPPPTEVISLELNSASTSGNPYHDCYPLPCSIPGPSSSSLLLPEGC